MLGTSRYSRAISQIEKKSQPINELRKELKKAGYKIKLLELIRIIFFILLYSSIISGIFSIIPEFQTFLKQVLKISGIVGSTVCLIIIGVASRYIALYSVDLQLIASKIISLQENGRTKLRKKER